MNSTPDFHPALGSPTTLPRGTQRLFASSDFEPKRAPNSGDWLAVHDEPGQTFSAFRSAAANVPDDARNVIYIQPLGRLPSTPSKQQMKAFAEAYFQTTVRIADPLDVVKTAVTARRNSYSGQWQLRTGDILSRLQRRLPTDAFALVGVTMFDLYPDERWNFVFGQASLRDRVGVYSFARYQSDEPRLTLRRSLKVMGHELGHMFGMDHCAYFECMMNGSNHLEEADRRPMHLCPVCLRKLMWSAGFDPRPRYEQLAPVYRRLRLNDEADWLLPRFHAMVDSRGQARR
jgi:archaemetzincin